MRTFLTGSRILLVGSTLFVVDSFVPWNRACRVVCVSFTLWHGVGIFAVLVALALCLWEATLVLGLSPDVGLPRTGVSAAGGMLVAFFTLLKLVVDFSYLWLGAWIGALLAAGLAYGAFLRLTEDGRPSPSERSSAGGPG